MKKFNLTILLLFFCNTHVVFAQYKVNQLFKTVINDLENIKSGKKSITSNTLQVFFMNYKLLINSNLRKSKKQLIVNESEFIFSEAKTLSINYSKIKQFDSALQILLPYGNLDSTDFEIKFFTGYNLYNVGRFADSYQYFNDCLNHNFNKSISTYYLFSISMKTSSSATDPLYNLYNNAQHEYPFTFYLITQYELSRNKYNDTIHLLTNNLEKYANSKEYYLLKAAYFNFSSNYNEALTTYAILLTKFPDIDPEIRNLVHYNMIVQNYNAGLKLYENLDNVKNIREFETKLNEILTFFSNSYQFCHQLDILYIDDKIRNIQIFTESFIQKNK